MSATSPPYDELRARFRAGLANEALSHRCVVTYPVAHGKKFVDVFHEVFATLTNGAVALPVESKDDAFLSARGDGILMSRASRGFMPGMGETHTYHLLVADDVRMDFEWWWEDNIGDPDALVFHLRARSAERLREAVSALKYAVINRGAPWKDPFERAPKRLDRARVDAAVRGFTDPALAWAALAPANARWTFVEQVFENCSSCSGSGLDPDAGACYACSHNGKVIKEYRWTPHPPSMPLASAFASDLAAMLDVDAAVCALMERLAPWGHVATTDVEWLAEERYHPGASAPEWIPNCMVAVFKALGAALHDPTIPEWGHSPGWFSQGARAWQDATHMKPFADRANPFEPLRIIMAAGYRLTLVGNETIPTHARLSVDI